MDEADAINPVQVQMEVEKVEQSNLENSGMEEVEMIGHPDNHSESSKLDQTTYKLAFGGLPIEMYHFCKRRMLWEEEFLVISFRILEILLIRMMMITMLLNYKTIKME